MKEISKKNFDGYKYVDGGVCAAKGFKANGLYCGIKENPTKNLTSALWSRTLCVQPPAFLLRIRSRVLLLLFLRKILLKQAARLRALSSTPKTLTPATLTVRKRLTKCAR